MPPWKQTVRVLFVIHLLTAAGFSLVVPFLPLYVKQLGVATRGSVAFWSGVIFAAPAITMMLAAPLWGFLADRHGRKLMLVRSTIAGGVLLGAMGFVTNAEELALLRALQGSLTGYIAASNALVAATIPREHAGESFAYLRTGTWVGAGVGPLLGGVIGELFGFRQSFWVTGMLLLAAGCLAIFAVKESFKPVEPQKKRSFLASYRLILTTPGLPRLYSMSFVDNLGRSMLLPILPLFMLSLMGTLEGVASATGILMGVKAICGSLAALWVGRLGDRIGHGKVIVIASIAMVALYVPQPFVTAPWQLITLQILTGFAAVGIIPGVGALISLYVPEGSAGATFALNSSVEALARTVAPMLGAAIAAGIGMRAVFIVTAGAYALVVLLARPLYPVVAQKTEGNIPA